MAEPSTLQSLSKKTAVQLRLLCKDLGITGVSKLNKTQLAQRIIESAAFKHVVNAEAGATGVGQTLPPPEETVPGHPQASDSTTIKSSAVPAGNTKRKSSAASTKQPRTKKAKGRAREDEEGGNPAVQPTEPTSTLVGTVLPATSTRISLNDISRGAQSFQAPARATTRRHASSSAAPTRAATTTTTEAATPAAGTLTPYNASTLSDTSPPQPPPPPPHAVPRAPKKQTQVPPGRLVVKQQFVPPKAIGNSVESRNPNTKAALSTLQHPLVPLAAESAPAESVRTNRISHVCSHFLNRLFANLDGCRTIPGPTTPSTIIGFPSLAFTGFHQDIYSASNDELQVALRWWIWRMHTALQLGSGEAWSAQGGGLGLLGPDMSTWPPVVACKQVAAGIFCVTTMEPARLTFLPPHGQTDSKAASKKTGKASRRSKSNRASAASTEPAPPTELVAVKYLTIGITGEVISSSRRQPAADSSEGETQLLIEDCPVRPDWHAFISARKLSSSPGSPPPALVTLVKTKDANDAPHGISKAWRTRMETANAAANHEAVEVAERAVLASCALNSFSGDKLSMMQMDAEWLGNAIVTDRASRERVELYLPEPLQILSVHLPPPPCHPSIAIAHRSSGRSDYVLRETGQVIGDEDGGVAELWQGILGCDYKGAEKDVSECWKGWQDRIVADEDE